MYGWKAKCEDGAYEDESYKKFETKYEIREVENV